jgi:signal transduction histidine kinase
MDCLCAKCQSDPVSSAPEVLESVELIGGAFPCGILVLDGQQHVCAFSAEAERLTRLKASEVIKRPMSDLPLPLRELINERIAAGEGTVVRQISLGGAEITIQAISAPVQQGALSGWIILAMADARGGGEFGPGVQRLNRLASIGALAAGMAHEVKNALVAVRTFVDDLLHRNRDTELSTLVSRELRRVDTIVSQMLRFAGPGKPTFAAVSLHRILDHALRLMQPQLESKQIHLRRSFQAHPELVDGDGYQLEQVFINLFLNAAAAMDSNGRLTVSTEIVRAVLPSVALEEGEPEPMLQVTIVDSGPGIPPDVLPRLFEPFFTTKPQGTGLGLAITRRIVIEHGGTISVESQSGQGATFRLLFPPARA